jgi:hypothetical protein
MSDPGTESPSSGNGITPQRRNAPAEGIVEKRPADFPASDAPAKDTDRVAAPFMIALGAVFGALLGATCCFGSVIAAASGAGAAGGGDGLDGIEWGMLFALACGAVLGGVLGGVCGYYLARHAQPAGARDAPGATAHTSVQGQQSDEGL